MCLSLSVCIVTAYPIKDKTAKQIKPKYSNSVLEPELKTNQLTESEIKTNQLTESEIKTNEITEP